MLTSALFVLRCVKCDWGMWRTNGWERMRVKKRDDQV